uniref:Uncharacterized protein n=1 Tax=Anguilla anguilla TaxID=7936 RepID=A0A0E9WJ23_ANGAN
MEQLLVNTRSSWLPALCVGGEEDRDRAKDWRSEATLDSWEVSGGRLKSPSRIAGVPSSGRELRRVSSSSRKEPSGPGGQYRTIM